MTATAGFAQDTIASDPSDPDGPIFRNSPPMTAYRPRIEPSPSPPPALPLAKVSSPPSPGRKASNRKKKVQPSQGDGVLVHYLGGGKDPELAEIAAAEPLDGGHIDEPDEEDESMSDDDKGDDESHTSSTSAYIATPKMSPGPVPVNGSVDFTSLAGFAVGAVALLGEQGPAASTVPQAVGTQNGRLQEKMGSSAKSTPAGEQRIQARPSPPLPQIQPHPQLQPLQSLPGRDVSSKTGLAMPMTPYTPNGPDLYSPRLPPASVLRAPDIISPAPTTSSHGELPPIMVSPKSETNGGTSLPSLPSIGLLTEQPPLEKDVGWRYPIFPQSPPGTGVSRMSITSGITSPTSPNYPYSPAQSAYSQSYGSYSTSSGYGRHASDFSSATSHHAQSPPTIEQNPTPISNDPRDRMSIDHMTNSQIGQFVCKFAGCNAAPFQTQYLLNSHANVHSSARPHYCPVSGCPRAEGGKGFKRKNEMIRHGLVHESPGYVCPFCPDREHKYPRPDNLQRHVRVHHVDKDKDDPQLRDVLAQRPDGPNRGRRRRGVS